MRVVLACLACTVGCGFQTPTAVVDASDANQPDSAIDAGVPPDSGPVPRTIDRLIGLWELNDATTSTIVADTSGANPSVPLVISEGAVTFANGKMTPSAFVRIESTPKPHLDQEVIASKAVTLEAWVTPSLAEQGSTRPYVVAGLSASINGRNVSLMQAGTHWLARVRTTSDMNGRPELLATATITAGRLVHLAVVSDATQRILYIDGVPAVVDPAPSAPAGWDRDYRMLLGKEFNTNEQWSGTYSLVAIYDRALSPVEIAANFQAGPGDP